MKTEELIRQLEIRSNCQWVDMPEYSRIDGALIKDGSIEFFFELKCRNFASNAYDSVLVDYAKWAALKEMQSLTQTATYLAVGYTDRWGYVNPTSCQNFKISTTTPSMESVSFNKGVARTTVEIPLSEMMWFYA